MVVIRIHVIQQRKSHFYPSFLAESMDHSGKIHDIYGTTLAQAFFYQRLCFIHFVFSAERMHQQVNLDRGWKASLLQNLANKLAGKPLPICLLFGGHARMHCMWCYLVSTNHSHFRQEAVLQRSCSFLVFQKAGWLEYCTRLQGFYDYITIEFAQSLRSNVIREKYHGSERAEVH